MAKNIIKKIKAVIKRIILLLRDIFKGCKVNEDEVNNEKPSSTSVSAEEVNVTGTTTTSQQKDKKVWVSKGKVTKLVLESDLQQYLSKGYIRGRGKKKGKGNAGRKTN